MPSPLRYIPEEAKLWTDSQGRKYAIVEITVRCLQGRSLLKPTPESTSLILGVLGRAQATLDFPLFGYGFLSNHGSYLAGVRSVEHQASIMEFVHGNIAREVGHKENVNWSGKFWGRRGRPILVSSDADLEERLKYLLSNSTKEHLVLHPTRWPGVHCAKALCHGTTDKGLWLDRTELHRLNRNKEPDDRVSEGSATTYYDVNIEKLPSQNDKTDEEYRRYIKDLCRVIAEEAARDREENGGSVIGVNTILAQDPYHRPENLSCSPAPPVHCSDRAARTKFLDAYRAFVDAYRHAFAALRKGIAGFDFPDGGAPPGCRFCPVQVPDTG